MARSFLERRGLLDNGSSPHHPNRSWGTHNDRGIWTTGEDWHWETAPPADWRPLVERLTVATIAVSFHTYRAIGTARISRHVDVYERGSLRPHLTQAIIVAEGPPGIML